MKKPYLSKYSDISKFSVWIVDGEYVRDNIDEEFTNFGQHYRFRFIPVNEFWIDKEYSNSEEEFYISHMLVEHKLMSEGKSYDESIEKADEIEKGERSKDELIKKEIGKKRRNEEILKKIRKRLLKKYSGKVKIFVVNGELVRDLFFIDFTEGGHDKVYPFIPSNEVWIDDAVSQKERKFILLHELHERNLMARGWSYDKKDEKSAMKKQNKNTNIHKSAHKSASKIEYFCRFRPEKTEELIKKEIQIGSSESSSNIA